MAGKSTPEKSLWLPAEAHHDVGLAAGGHDIHAVVNAVHQTD